MKRQIIFAIAFALLIVTPFALKAQAPADAPVSLVIMGSGHIEDNLEGRTWGAGIETGFQVMVDGGRGMSIRTTFKRANFGPSLDNGIGSVTTSGIVDWAVGDSWDVFINFGAENFVDGEFKGTDMFFGLGAGFNLLKSTNPEYEIPPQLRGFIEVSFSDANSQPTDNYFEIKLGLLLPKPKKHSLVLGRTDDLPNPIYFSATRLLHYRELKLNENLFIRYVLNPETVGDVLNLPPAEEVIGKT